MLFFPGLSGQLFSPISVTWKQKVALMDEEKLSCNIIIQGRVVAVLWNTLPTLYLQ